MPWYFLFFSVIVEHKDSKQFCSTSCFLAYLGLGDTRALRGDIVNQPLNFTFRQTSDKSGKINKQDWNWNIIVALLPMMRQVFILNFHLEITCLRGILRPNFKRRENFFITPPTRYLELEGPVCLKGWNILLVMECIRTNRVCNDSSLCEHHGSW